MVISTHFQITPRLNLFGLSVVNLAHCHTLRLLTRIMQKVSDMQNYEIIVEWNNCASNILYEKRTQPKTQRGVNRQLANVVKKYEEYFGGYDVMRLTVTAL